MFQSRNLGNCLVFCLNNFFFFFFDVKQKSSNIIKSESFNNKKAVQLPPFILIFIGSTLDVKGMTPWNNHVE